MYMSKIPGPPRYITKGITEKKPIAKKGDTPFDLWLDRGLRTLYGNVADEPIPDDLLRLLKSD